MRGVSFDLAAGETLAIVGESGSGKSVTALSTVRLLPDNADITGSVRYRGREMVTADERTLRKVRGNDISFIFQEPMTSLNPLHTIERQLGESLALHQGLTGAAARARILELLTKVGIRDPESRLGAYPHQLSGGQRQRVMIAMALANGPDVLIADEPTTALDVTIQAQILTLLADAPARRGHGDAVHHPRPRHRAPHRRPGRGDAGRRDRRDRADRGDLRRARSIPTPAMLLAAEPTGRARPGAGRRAGRWSRPTRPARLVPDPARPAAPHRRPRQGGERRHRRRSAPARRSGVVGESGSGKTTLALAIMRLISSEGPIVFLGQDIQGWKHRELRRLRRDMQMVFQDPYGSLSPAHVGRADRRRGARRARLGRATSATGSPAILREVGLDPAIDAPLPARVLRRPAPAHRHRPRDDPAAEARGARRADQRARHDRAGADRRAAARLQAKYGLAYIFISHDLRVVRALAHEVVVMQNGDVVESGDSARRSSPRRSTDYTRTLLAAAFDLELAAE